MLVKGTLCLNSSSGLSSTRATKASSLQVILRQNGYLENIKFMINSQQITPAFKIVTEKPYN